MRSDAPRPTLLANITWSGLGQIVEFTLVFISSIVLARGLGPDARGVYAIIVTLASLTAVVLGNNAVFSGLTFLIGKKRYPISKLGGLALWTALIPALLLTATLMWLPESVLQTYLPGAAAAEVRLLFLWTLQRLIHGRVAAMLAGVDRIRLAVSISVSYAFADLLLQVYFLLVIGMGLEGGLRQLFFSGLLRGGISLLVLYSVFGINLRLERSIVQDLLAYAGKYYFGSVSKQWLERADLYFVGLVAGTTAAGYYAVARGFATMITLVEPPIRQAIIPKVVAGDFKQAAKLVSRAFSAGFWLTTILALLAAILSPWIIPLVYGQAFVAAVPAFLLLLPSMVLLANLTIEVFFYYQLGRPEVPTSVVVATALLGIPILYLFTVHWGYLGTALGTSVLAGVRAAAIIIAYLHLSRESLGQLFAIKRSELTILSHMMKGSGR